MQVARRFGLDPRVRDRAALLVLLTMAGSSCSSHRPDHVSPIMREAPTIESLDPATGWAGQAYPITVAITGQNFAEFGNLVTFGSLEIDARPSSDDGRRIVFSVPKVMPASGEVPPMVLQPGEYEVRVTTTTGTSEPAVFTLTMPGSR